MKAHRTLGNPRGSPAEEGRESPRSTSHPLNRSRVEPWQEQVRRLRKRASLVNAAATLLWLDRQTTAAYLGIGRSKLDELASLGVLKPCKLGRRTIFNRQHLDAYLSRLAGLTPLGQGEKT